MNFEHEQGYDQMRTINRCLTAVLLATATPVLATPATETSPGGPLPSGVTKVGGIVVDLKGTNGTRVVSQLAASQLYKGFADFNENPKPGNALGNPLLIGTQTGFNSTVLGALGGGLSSASIRVTLFDGDSAAGDFDFNDNTFFVNGVSFGNWSSVATTRTNDTGTVQISSGTGFGNSILSTGFFTLSDAGSLSNLFASLGGGSLAFTLFDVDPNDNFYDFTLGVDGSLIDIGQGPIVTPGIPEPATWAMMVLGFGAIGTAIRRRRTVPSYA